MEGAVSYTITFDPMTKTELDRDFVRFIKVRPKHKIKMRTNRTNRKHGVHSTCNG